ncbi:MAG: isopentenyl phosphate kinase [Candidatus Heimdallarchaeaceae archaeon]
MLNNNSIDIIKLGGAVITDKTEYKKIRLLELRDICQQIGEWGNPCIIVHGAGSYGHIRAKEYNITSGFKESSQIQGLLQIRKDMRELTSIVVEELTKANLKAMSFQTSSLIYSKNQNTPYEYFLNPIQIAMQLRLVPILSGDIVFVNDADFNIISGDVIIDILANNFQVNRVIFITDVDGLMVTNPETNKKECLMNPSVEDLQSLSFTSDISEETIDVTGSMKGKVESILSILKSVNEIIIVNGQVNNRVSDVLKEKNAICTRIK